MYLEAVIERVWGRTGRPCSSELRDALGCCNGASLEMHLEAEIKSNSEKRLEAVIRQVWRCMWRPQWCNSEIHLETMIEWTPRFTWMPRSSQIQRCTWTPWSSKFAEVFGGRDHVTQWCTWRLWSNKFGEVLGGHDHAQLEDYMEVVDRRRAGCQNSIHQLLNSQLWECDEVTLSLSSLMESWLMTIDLVGRHGRSWSYIQGSTCNRENGDEDGNNMEDTSGYEKAGVQLAWLGLDDLQLLFLPARWGVVPAVPGMVN